MLARRVAGALRRGHSLLEAALAHEGPEAPQPLARERLDPPGQTPSPVARTVVAVVRVEGQRARVRVPPPLSRPPV